MFPRSSTPPTDPRSSSPARRGVSRGGIHKRRGGPPRVDKDGDLLMDMVDAKAIVGSGDGRSEGNKPTKSRGGGRGGQITGTPRGNFSTQQSQQAIIRGLELQQANILESRISQSSFTDHGGPGRNVGWRDAQTPLVSLRVRGLKESKAASNPDGGLKDLLSFLERKANGQDVVESHKTVKIKKSYMDGDSVIITASADDLARISKLNNFKFAGSSLNIEPHQVSPSVPSIKDQEDMSYEAKKTQERIKSILSARYDINLKLLNLSRLGQDPGLVQMGMFDAKKRISKLFPVLMVICDRLFTSAQEKRDAILSVTLAENDLDNISNVITLAQTFPDLQNLDLSRNKIGDLHALGGWRWKFRNLRNLKLTENPIVSNSPSYTQEIAKWFPTLQVLNDIQIRTASEAAAASSMVKPLDLSKETGHTSPIPINGPDFRDVNQIGEGFLMQFFNLYDTDRATLANKFYDANSTHSLSINVSAPRSDERASSHPFPSAVFNNSRNLVKVRALHGQMSKIFRGVQAIKTFWAQLPQTNHPDLLSHTTRYIVDCHPLAGVLDPMEQSTRGVDGLILMVHGEYEEVDISRSQQIKRSFSRTFVLGPGLPAGPIIRVISDILVLRAWTPLVSLSSEQGTQTTSEEPTVESTQDVLLKQLVFQTQLTPEYARLCLKETGWDLEKAVVAFEANKSKLPVHAFIG